MTAILQAKSLTVGYDKQEILNNLSFSLRPGEVACLMGANGCGKTTLLRTLAGLKKSIRGDVEIAGQGIGECTVKELAKKISVVLTDRPELSNLQVYDVVALGRFPYTNFWGSLSKNDNRVIEESLQLLDIKKLSDSFFEELSDGQKQKVLIARAIAQNTPILILDEPITFLDIPRKMEIVQILKRIAKEKSVAVLYSSHDWDLALEMANKVWVINSAGELVEGLPEDLILNGKFGTCFEHEQFAFDEESGSFKEKIEAKRTVGLLGKQGKQTYWIYHALRKNGYKVNMDDKKQKFLINLDERIQLQHIDSKILYNSIEELLNGLDKRWKE